MLKPGWNSASCKSHNISHFFFPLQAQSHRKNSGGREKKVFFFFFFFLWSQRSKMGEEGGRGGGGGGSKTQQAPPPKKSQIKKSKKNRTHTHTEKMNTSLWTDEKKNWKEKNVNDAGFKGELLLNSARRSFNTVQSFFIFFWGGVEWSGVGKGMWKQQQLQTTINNKIKNLESSGEFQIGSPWSRPSLTSKIKNKN